MFWYSKWSSAKWNPVYQLFRENVVEKWYIIYIYIFYNYISIKNNKYKTCIIIEINCCIIKLLLINHLCVIETSISKNTTSCNFSDSVLQ